VKALLIIIVAIMLFGGLILLKLHIAADLGNRKVAPKIGDISVLENKIKSDSLYTVRDVLYRDSGMLIALDNPGKSGAEFYFDKKYKLNDYGNINMVYIFQYDTSRPLQKASFDDALMAKGKKMARFQSAWTLKFIDTTDGSCKPLKKLLQQSMHIPASFQNEETSFQPASIYKMQVNCKYLSADSLGKKTLNEVTALVDTAGSITLVDKAQ
jgi:hypothetical protein